MRRKPLTKRGYDRTRTGDLRICNPTLYQSSYAPIGTESIVNRPEIILGVDPDRSDQGGKIGVD